MIDFILNNKENFKYIPTHLFDNKCFACGKNNPESLKMTFYTYEKYLFSQVNIDENKRGWEQIVHGGIISTILDEIMAWTAIYFTKSFMLTKSININYLNSITVNSTVKSLGWIEKKLSKKELIIKSRIYSEENKLCAEAEGRFAIFSERLARKFKLMTDESFNRFNSFLNACDQ